MDKAVEVLQEQGLSASGMPCNVTDEAQRQALFDFVVANHRTLDSLILNQGATAGGGPLMDATESQWAKVMATNLVSPATESSHTSSEVLRLAISNSASTGPLAAYGQTQSPAAQARPLSATRTIRQPG